MKEAHYSIEKIIRGVLEDRKKYRIERTLTCFILVRRGYGLTTMFMAGVLDK